MDLRAYYKTVRDTEATLPSPHVVMTSLATRDGGKEGVVTEVPTPVAARMIVEGSARRATDSEASAFHEKNAATKQAAEDAAHANRMHVVVVPASSTPIKPPVRSGKEQ